MELSSHVSARLSTALWSTKSFMHEVRHKTILQFRAQKLGAIHSTKISGNFGPKLNGSVRSNRKSFGKTGPPFEVVHFSRSDRSEFWLNGSRPLGIEYLLSPKTVACCPLICTWSSFEEPQRNGPDGTPQCVTRAALIIASRT